MNLELIRFIVIYINTMLEVSNAENIYLFADDTKMYQEITSADDEQKLQTDIDDLYD